MMFYNVMLIILFALFIRNVFQLIFNIQNVSTLTYRRRRKQLDFNKENDNTTEKKLFRALEAVTNPIVEHVYPNLPFSDMSKIEKFIANKMALARWYLITPKQFIALMLFTIGLGTLTIFLSINSLSMEVVFISIAIVVIPYVVLISSIGSRESRLLSEFPNFVMMMQVFLSDGGTLKEALISTSRYMSEDWRDIIEQMAIIAEGGEIEKSLEVLTKEFNAVEVKEFVAIVRLSINYGGDLGDAFRSQVDRMIDIQNDLDDIEIAKRKTITTVIQMPLMGAILIIIASPIVENIMEFFSSAL